MEFGKRLKELRTNAKLTQKQLAEMLGVTKSVVSFYELQERSPSPEVLIKLTEIFHVSADYLLDIRSDKTLDLTGISCDDVALLVALANRLRNGKK